MLRPYERCIPNDFCKGFSLLCEKSPQPFGVA